MDQPLAIKNIESVAKEVSDRAIENKGEGNCNVQLNLEKKVGGNYRTRRALKSSRVASMSEAFVEQVDITSVLRCG